MSAYKYTGDPLGEKCRVWNTWILVTGGEETRFTRKKHALMCAAVAKAKGLRTELFQETTMRFRRGGRWENDKVYRINISNQIQ